MNTFDILRTVKASQIINFDKYLTGFIIKQRVVQILVENTKNLDELNIKCVLRNGFLNKFSY